MTSPSPSSKQCHSPINMTKPSPRAAKTMSNSSSIEPRPGQFPAHRQLPTVLRRRPAQHRHSLAPAGTTPQAALGPTSTGFVETSASPVAQSLSPDPIVSPGTGAFRRSGPFVTRLEAPVVGSINLFHGFGDLANADVASWNIDRQGELLLDLQATSSSTSRRAITRSSAPKHRSAF